jgi:membrane protein implicated in regulation of membrane protease activity
MSVGTIWLSVGVLALFAEAFGAVGFGLFFTGLGAIVTGALINHGTISQEDMLIQLLVFLLSSGVWALILWKPLQRFRINRKNPTFSNIVGDTAMVGDKGVGLHDGEVLWSGTIMKAQLANDAGVSHLGAGAIVEVTEVSGAKLIVKPKKA